MKNKILPLLILTLIGMSANATHNRGGEITCRYIAGFTYEITITTYTKTSSIQANRPILDSVNFGDGTPPGSFTRSSISNLANDVSQNTYVKQHTYPAMGRYIIYLEDPNRDDGSCNIPNSIYVPFSITSYITILDPAFYCINNSCTFVAIPIFFAQIGQDFKMNIAATDIDDDSLSYQLTPCLGENHLPVLGYTLPPSVTVNSHNGEFIWRGSGMVSICEYNFAVRIDEWRKGYNIGSTIRDFQVNVDSAINTSYSFLGTSSFPTDSFGNYMDSIHVGDTLNISLSYSGTLGSPPTLASYSKAFLFSNPPTFTTTTGATNVDGVLRWIQTADKISKNPYIFIFRGTSDFGEEDLTFRVYVPGIKTDTCPAFPFISVPEYADPQSVVQVSPNPFNNKILLSFTENKEENIQLNIYDGVGKIVFSKKIPQSKQEFDLSMLKEGIYFLNLQSRDKSISLKIVKI